MQLCALISTSSQVKYVFFAILILKMLMFLGRCLCTLEKLSFPSIMEELDVFFVFLLCIIQRLLMGSNRIFLQFEKVASR